MKDCKMEAEEIDLQKRVVEEARSRLNDLGEVKDAAPLDLVVDMYGWEDCARPHETSHVEVAELKKKLTTSLELEKKLYKIMGKERALLDYLKAIKKAWLQERWWNYDHVSILKQEERVAMHQIEAKKKRREEHEKMDVA